MVKNLPAMREVWVHSLGWEDPLKKGTATHSSILAWRIPWTEESGSLQPVALQSPTGLSCFHFFSLHLLNAYCVLGAYVYSNVYLTFLLIPFFQEKTKIGFLNILLLTLLSVYMKEKRFELELTLPFTKWTCYKPFINQSQLVCS